jgi:hypothetical protein
MGLNHRKFLRECASLAPDRSGATSLRGARIEGIMTAMSWTTPAYEEMKMDAEIGSYQEDGEWPPIVERADDADAE